MSYLYPISIKMWIPNPNSLVGALVYYSYIRMNQKAQSDSVPELNLDINTRLHSWHSRGFIARKFCINHLNWQRHKKKYSQKWQHLLLIDK